MRGIIHDLVSHTYIEGPMQSKPVNDSFQAGNDEKAAYHADLTQGYEVEDDANDIDIPYYEANERYD